jgi:hypothetical protein
MTISRRTALQLLAGTGAAMVLPGAWHYNRRVFEQHRYKTAKQVAQMLVDIISKNGCLQLSIPVRGNGTIDEDEVQMLEDFARWIGPNGDAIYATRPWVVYGEGPSTDPSTQARGQFGGARDVCPYTGKDVRYVMKGDALYAWIMAWPEDGKVTLKSLATGSAPYPRKVAKVQLLGSDQDPKFTQDGEGLQVTMPGTNPTTSRTRSRSGRPDGTYTSRCRRSHHRPRVHGSIMRIVSTLTALSLLVSAAPSAAQAPARPPVPSTAPVAAARPPVDPATVPPPFTSPAEVYSGISGTGRPVVGNGGGGWRSNQVFLGYDGPDPKPGWRPLGQYACTSSAVHEGLIPPIKPIWDLHLRDTVITVGGDGLYYMTGSSGDNIWDRNDGIELWRSRDLKAWDYLGLVWSYEKDATWAKRWGALHDHPVRAVWAPEIHYLKSKKNYYLTYSNASGAGTGLLVSTTGKPEGPYVNPLKPDARLGGGIDATLFEDDDGRVYMTSGRGGYIALMKDDLSGIAEQRNVKIDKSNATSKDGKPVPEDLLRRVETGMEGASLFKRNGKYYLGAAVFWGGTAKGRYDSVVCIADTIWGPYSQWHEAVPCGGGTNYFQDHDGNWWCAYFGNDEQTPFREKPGLIRIDFDRDGKIIVADEQPAFVLQDGVPTNWRIARAAATRPGAAPR